MVMMMVIETYRRSYLPGRRVNRVTWREQDGFYCSSMYQHDVQSQVSVAASGITENLPCVLQPAACRAHTKTESALKP